MILSTNSNPRPDEFEKLLIQTRLSIESDADNRPSYYSKRKGTLFEKDVCDKMCEQAIDSPFEGSIELKSGRGFPDIIAREVYGVEVKTSTQGSPWKCVGNSVLESSRIESVERIYIFFGMLMPPPEFKFRKYEDCLYDVAVTHSPRYMVDLETTPGNTIFDKIGITYNQLRSENNPISSIMEYFRRNLGDRGDIWWLDTGEPDCRASNVVIRFWSALSEEEKNQLRLQILALFPEVIQKGGAGSRKYERAAAWLIKTKNVVAPSFRDMFTGGKKSDVTIDQQLYHKVPTFFAKRLMGNINTILTLINNTSEDEIALYWGEDNVSNRQRYWLNKFKQYSDEWLMDSNLDIQTFLSHELSINSD